MNEKQVSLITFLLRKNLKVSSFAAALKGLSPSGTVVLEEGEGQVDGVFLSDAGELVVTGVD